MHVTTYMYVRIYKVNFTVCIVINPLRACIHHLTFLNLFYLEVFHFPLLSAVHDVIVGQTACLYNVCKPCYLSMHRLCYFFLLD